MRAREMTEPELVDEAKRAHRAVGRLRAEMADEVGNRRAALAELVERKVMSQTALAEELGVAPQRIGQMIREGQPKK